MHSVEENKYISGNDLSESDDTKPNDDCIFIKEKLVQHHQHHQHHHNHDESRLKIFMDTNRMECQSQGKIDDKKTKHHIKSLHNKLLNNRVKHNDNDKQLSLNSSVSPSGTEADDLVYYYDDIATAISSSGKIKNKNRNWERKQKTFNQSSNNAASIDNESLAATRRGIARTARSRVLRRNTMDCALLNKMYVNDDSVNVCQRRINKRAQALLRESERELKNSLALMNNSNVVLSNYNACINDIYEGKLSHHSEASDKWVPLRMESMPSRYQHSKVIESCNRYMSVSSRPIGCRSSAPPHAFASSNQFLNESLTVTPSFKVRKEFHETFANLIKLGSVDRQDMKLSHEEYTWQTEVKDVIWLELQAWQADRTLEQQDKYLFTARKGVSEILIKIMNYKFHPRYRKQVSTISLDSGLGVENQNNASSMSKICSGCLSLYCSDCIEQQDLAMAEVEELLIRLEAAEALYSSTITMGAFHPIYKDEAFVGRVKTMCQWYNITKQSRLKLSLLGVILTCLQEKKFSWPIQITEIPSHNTATDTSSGHSSISGIENDDLSKSSIDSIKSGKKDGASSNARVHFLLNDAASQMVNDASISSNDSNSQSMDGSQNLDTCSPLLDGHQRNSIHDLNIFSIEPARFSSNGSCDPNPEQSSPLYRKFIENVLKSRGLAKALAFLHKLHNVVMCKAQISLEKPSMEDYDFEMEKIEEDYPRLESDIEREQIEELRRYGLWSKEYKLINLPTYIPLFVFLSGVPLQFMHEYLRMRLETRPLKPNPLSLTQLMKELREGLTLALTHRERYQRHISIALAENEVELERYMGYLEQYDETVRKVFELYLDYIDQLVLVSIFETNQKHALEKEWTFTKLISPMIRGMHVLASQKFCTIIRNLLKGISERLVNRAKELDMQIDDTAQNFHTEFKWQILTICRETQTLFTTERETSVKVLFFAKTFCRDVESMDFHREHCLLEDDCDGDGYGDGGGKPIIDNIVCDKVMDSFKLLQCDILDVRNKLTKIIERVQTRCSPDYVAELEEQDRQAVLSRTREILHQGYKFGFEYHKDMIRLFEHRIVAQKDNECGHELAIGIITFAKMWMQFVTERCERGRGMRPRWASQGLEFLILACDPQVTQHLNDNEFEELKKKMDLCISHVIGITSEPEKSPRKKASPRSKKATSPVAMRSRTPNRSPMSAGVLLQSPQCNKFLHPQFSCKEDMLQSTSSLDSTDGDLTITPSNCHEVTGDLRIIVPSSSNNNNEDHNIVSADSSRAKAKTDNTLALRQIRIRDAVNRLDMILDEKLRERNLIGQVKALNTIDKIHIRARSVNFHWHRGMKIGQGRFGKVYTAVNNNTGELMAMKEIAIHPGESRILKNVAEELKILEGIKHENLVRYYGIEVHREELLIFMELCSEGTLESLIELTGILPEGLTRRFTVQLLSAVAELHKHGIVHRDIKTANIFLVSGGNSLKLGDFGSAVKIQAHTTVPGELQSYVGTQAYMAPEVFTKTNGDGHGRAADIWSVGCVVVEMASGKRPWAQFDSNFQIMFKVGMGEKPEAPETLSQEGHDFIKHCLQHDPKDRLTALELLDHDFCKYDHNEYLSAEHIEDTSHSSFHRYNNKLK